MREFEFRPYCLLSGLGKTNLLSMHSNLSSLCTFPLQSKTSYTSNAHSIPSIPPILQKTISTPSNPMTCNRHSNCGQKTISTPSYEIPF